MATEQTGAESRTQILPSSEPRGIGFLGPDYDYADRLIPPNAIGVRKEGSLRAVVDGIRGVGYYVDTIAFGQSGGGLTRGLPFQRYGVNYFVKNGAKCSNGADAYTYMELIPKGDAFGENVRKAVQGIGLAELRGLAPGVIEDVKAATDVRPLMKALMGSGYARCELVTKPVGDELGRIQSPEGKPWTDEPSTVQYVNGRSFQTRWVVKDSISKSEYDDEMKKFKENNGLLNPDGTSIETAPTEAFMNGGQSIGPGYLALIAALLGLANMWAYQRRR